MRCLLPESRARRLPWTDLETMPDIVIGNVLDEESLYHAVTGVHTIIHLESAQWWGRERNLERVELSVISTFSILPIMCGAVIV